MEPDLAAALQRLTAFRSHWSEDAVVDESSGLTAADLDTILSSAGAMEHFAEAVEHGMDA